MAAPITLHLEFGGGAELLFEGVKDHQVTLPSQSQPWSSVIMSVKNMEAILALQRGLFEYPTAFCHGDMKQLLVWIRANMLKERPELFVQGDTVRPGILVLINDADWELMGELTYELQDRDTVVFISTLHGG